MVERYPDFTPEATGLDEKLNTVWEKKTRVQTDSMVSGWSTWENGTALYAGGGRLEASGFGVRGRVGACYI